jgi:putative cell wall-binding protein
MTQTHRLSLGAVPRALAVLVAAVLLLALAPLTGTARAFTGDIEVKADDGLVPSFRFAGEDRFETAGLIATDDTVGAADFDGDDVMIARADIFPDALAASVLGGLEDAPLLLSYSDSPFAGTDLQPDLVEAIDEFEDTLDEIFLLGGEAALDAEVEAALEDEYPDATITRIGGLDRFETAAMISDRVPQSDDVIVSNAGDNNLVDALVSGSIAATAEVPILLVSGSGDIHPATAERLDELNPDRVLLAGGNESVSDDVADQIEEITGEGTVVRVEGANRFATAVEFAELGTAEFGFGTDHVNLARGDIFPDALALGPHSHRDLSGVFPPDGNPAPIVLTQPDDLPDETRDYFEEITSCEFQLLHVAGGTVAVSDDVEDESRQILTNPGDACRIDLTPETATNLVGESHTVTISVTDNAGGAPDDNVEVEIVVEETGTAGTGGDETSTAMPESATVTTDDDGEATFTFTSNEPGDFVITATVTDSDGVERTATAFKSFVLPDGLVGITNIPFLGEVVLFDENGEEESSTVIVGLNQRERIVGADFRPATGELFALTNEGRLLILEPQDDGTTVATERGQLDGSMFDFENGVGFDFNPMVDRIRIVTSADDNLRVNPNDGALVMADGDLTYAAGDENEGEDPGVTAAGYENSTSETATVTELYVIDTDLDVLAIQAPPNDGVLNTVGDLGVDATGVNGFDIVVSEFSGENVGFAIFNVEAAN